MIAASGVSADRAGRRVVENVDLAIPAGGVTALIGPNGAGKSTLLSLAAGLLPVSAGTITIDGHDVARTSVRALARCRAVMPQEAHIASRLAVAEMVGLGRFPHHRGRPRPADHAAVAEALSLFELEGLADRFVDTLSGGQRQRARVAMAYAQGTDYLLLDEPLNNLDIVHARALMRTLRRIADEGGRTILVVVHDLNHAAAHADRIVAMRDGRIVAHGTPDEVITTGVLSAIYGEAIPVTTVEGRRVSLHHV